MTSQIKDSYNITTRLPETPIKVDNSPRTHADNSIKTSSLDIKFEIDETLTKTENFASMKAFNSKYALKFYQITKSYPFIRRAFGDKSIIYLLIGGLIIESYLTYSKDRDLLTIIEKSFETHISQQKLFLDRRRYDDFKRCMLLQYKKLLEEKKKNVALAIKNLYKILNPITNELFCKSLIIFIKIRILQYIHKPISKTFSDYMEQLGMDNYKIDTFYLNDFLYIFAEAFSFDINYIRINNEKAQEDISHRSSSAVQFRGTLFEFTSKSESFHGILYDYAYVNYGETIDQKSQSLQTKVEDTFQISNSESQAYKNKLLEPFNAKIELQAPLTNGSNKVEQKQPSEDLLICHRDNAEYQKELVFVNKCKHNYCIYCIEEIENLKHTKSETIFCPLRKCMQYVDLVALKIFRNEYKKKQAIFDQPKDKSKQTNLLSEIEDLNSSTKIELPTQPQPSGKETSALLNCSGCGKNHIKTRCFTNKKCNHTFCIDCIQEKFNSFGSICPLNSCFIEINKIEVTNFLEGFVINDSVNQIIEVTCKLCNEVNFVTKPKGCDLEYLKCIKCSKILCCVHNDLIDKCLCLCPQCISSFLFKPCFSEKICNKCKNKFCIDCKESYKDLTKFCNCKCELCYKQKENISQKFCNSCLHNANICFGCKEEGELIILYKFQCSHQLCQRCIFDNIIQKVQISKNNQVFSIEKLCPMCY